VQFLPDFSQKRTRYRASLRRATGNEWSYVYSNIKPRYPSRQYKDYETGKVLPLNKQFKIRFFGFLHQRVDHGPDKASKRFKQAHGRWEAGYGSRHRSLSTRVIDRKRPYI
jgi:hypothetical protein